MSTKKKVDPKYLKTVKIEFNDKEFSVELDTTPHRHEDEEYSNYKERLKTVRYFLKFKKVNYKHKSLSYFDKLIGKKGNTFIK